ncbi:uncharacterized protein LOC114725502 [Neltuma alba]|uniref:uncharacterized protein LOC114725502 n=1 Tax=Neltuma alba TaxID=207710 RepID=UPI0010A56CC1|nr:uncharacterized protein LOC114725502 [Prosopis alba]XP_028767851.1 uncharacterized protein LOC114725502 [Prosopis alba]XP_028767852.1 uncharacterized protein LOC114725502 [Prosopis alba]XP_028767853.1 uncharacterized protein LOC114725502 [Prosopis alba]XP_028767854.1 uncharacterized protein LOC114725502 [Prosopis alba]
MYQQNQGPGSSNPSSVPAKRKRGRPRKEGSTVQADITPVRSVPDNVIIPTQTAGTTGCANEEMLGKVVTGVIEGCFGGGYLLNVRIGDSPTYLRGVVFQPGQYVPVTPENDVAPHLEMMQRKDFPIPVLNPQAQMQSSIPPSGQGSKQPVESQPLVPISKDQVLPTDIHSGASVSLENQSASVLVPVTNIPTSDSSIPAGGIAQALSDPGHGSQSASIMKMECDKIVEQNANKLNTCRQVPETGADGGTEKDSKPTAEDTHLLPVIENIDKELQTGQQAGSSVQLNEQVQDLPKASNVELNLMPAPAGLEPIQSEEIEDEPKNFNVEVSQTLVSAVPEPMQTERIQDESKSFNIEVNQLPVSAEPEAMQSQQIHEEPKNANMELNKMPVSADRENVQSVDKLEDKPDSRKPVIGRDAVPSDSRFGSEGSGLPENSDSQSHGHTRETTKEDDVQPSGET